MHKLHELREARATKVAEMRGLVDKAASEKRDLGEQEVGRFDALKGEVAGLDVRIGQAETLAELERRSEAEPVTRHGGLARLESEYRIGRAIADWTRTGKLTGVEAEFAAEHRSGRENTFSAPISLFLGGGEQRATLTTPASAGGVLVPTSVGPIIDRLRPRLAVEQLGATVLTGLTGNLLLPRLKSSGVAGWVAEHQADPQADPTFDGVSLTPSTVTGTYEMSRRVMEQAPQVEQILRNDLGFLLAQNLDQAAVVGPGTSGIPLGIRYTSGVRYVPASGQFATANQPTIAELDRVFSALIGSIDSSNVLGSTGFLAHPLVRASLNVLRGGNGQSVGMSILQNEGMQWSTQIPANLGTGGNLAAIYFASWADLIVGYWSSVDFLLNPYADSIFRKGGTYLTAFLDANVAVRHPESFAFFEGFPVLTASPSVNP